LAPRPRDVLAFDIAGFAEAFAECGHVTRGSIGRPVSNKPNYRQHGILRDAVVLVRPAMKSRRLIGAAPSRSRHSSTSLNDYPAVRNGKRADVCYGSEDIDPRFLMPA
jgi:hypothetical protein